MIKLYLERTILDPNFVQVGHCGDTLLSNQEHEFQVYPFNESISNLSSHSRMKCCCCCRMYEGFGSVGYRRSFFHSNGNFTFENYLEIVLKYNKCFRSDDFIVSNYVVGKLNFFL